MVTFRGPASIHIFTWVSNITKGHNAGVCNIYLLKNHILMVERFVRRMLVLQSTVCTLLLDTPTNTSLQKQTKQILLLFIYLISKGLWIIYFHLLIPTGIFLEKERRNFVKT